MERKHQTETKLISLRSTSRYYYHDFDTTSIFVDEGKASIELSLTRNKGEHVVRPEIFKTVSPNIF